MGANSKIEWTHHTFNPWVGCSKVSAGCTNCYAESMMDKRLGKVQWGDGGTRVRTSAANWKKPLQWNKAAAAAGVRHRVFCASLADVFEDRKELVEWRADLFDLIDQTPHLDWLLLTKRPEHVLHILADMPASANRGRILASNVWIGTSVENQEQADKRIPELLRIPAAVRFLSMEPLLGPVDLTSISVKAEPGYFGDCLQWYHKPHKSGESLAEYQKIDWVIVGGESGHHARPMHPDWARSLRDQCQAAGVPYLFKQWGEWGLLSSKNLEGRALLNDGSSCLFTKEECDKLAKAHGGQWGQLNPTMISKCGKHAAGRVLDGRTWDEVPE